MSITYSVCLSQSFNHFIMAIRRVWLRKRAVQFLQDHRGLRDDWKSFTLGHFETGGVFRSTTYNIINNYLRRGNVDNKKES